MQARKFINNMIKKKLHYENCNEIYDFMTQALTDKDISLLQPDLLAENPSDFKFSFCFGAKIIIKSYW